MLQKPFDRLQPRLLRWVAQRDGHALGTGARSPADAVDIAFRHLRQIEIDHMGDAVDVDAAGSDVGGDQNAGAAGPKILQRALACILRFVAVDGFGLVAAFRKLGRDLVGAMLGAGEHDHPAHVFVLQQRVQKGALVARGHVINALCDAGRRNHLRRNLDPRGLA